MIQLSIPSPGFWQIVPMVLESAIIAGGIGWAIVNEREKNELRERIETLEESDKNRGSIPADD